MAWEISMTDEGWSSVYDNLHNKMNRSELIEALVANRIDECGDKQGLPLSVEAIRFLERSALKEFMQLPTEVLADTCFAYVEKHNICDNGGWNAWIDRHGYCTVKVS